MIKDRTNLSKISYTKSSHSTVGLSGSPLILNLGHFDFDACAVVGKPDSSPLGNVAISTS